MFEQATQTSPAPSNLLPPPSIFVDKIRLPDTGSRYTLSLTDFYDPNSETGKSIIGISISDSGIRSTFQLNGSPIANLQFISINDVKSGALQIVLDKRAAFPDYFPFSFAVTTDKERWTSAQSAVELIGNRKDELVHISSSERFLAIPLSNSFKLETVNGKIYLNEIERDDPTKTVLKSYELIFEHGELKVKAKDPITFAGDIPFIEHQKDNTLLVTGRSPYKPNSKYESLTGIFDADGKAVAPFRVETANNTPFAGSQGVQAFKQSNGDVVTVLATMDRGVTTISLARYKPDGSIDTEFRPATSTLNLNGRYQSLHHARLLNNDKILVLGSNFLNGSEDYIIARLNADGSDDLSFGNRGYISKDFNKSEDYPIDLITLSDNKFLVFGFRYDAQFGRVLDVTRFLENGSIDPSFHQTGTTTITRKLLGAEFIEKSFHLTKTGKIQIFGYLNPTPPQNEFTAPKSHNFILQLDQEGNIDKSFGINGISYIELPYFQSTYSSMSLADDGKIRILSLFDNVQRTLLIQLNENGLPDLNAFTPSSSIESPARPVRLAPNAWIPDDKSYLIELPAELQKTGINIKVERIGNKDDGDLFGFESNILSLIPNLKVNWPHLADPDQTSYQNAINIKQYKGGLELITANFTDADYIQLLLQSINFIYGKPSNNQDIQFHWSITDNANPNMVFAAFDTKVQLAAQFNSIPESANQQFEIPLGDYTALSIKDFPFYDNDAIDRLQKITIKKVSNNLNLLSSNGRIVEEATLTREQLEKGALKIITTSNSPVYVDFNVSDGKSDSMTYRQTFVPKLRFTNDPSTLAIQGSFKHSDRLSAVFNTSDVGLPNSIYYSWKIIGSNETFSYESFIPGAQNIGGKVQLTVWYVDKQGNQRVIATQSEATITAGNSLPRIADIAGRFTVGQELSFSGVWDDDGIPQKDGHDILSLQWKADGRDIIGANNTKLLITENLIGKNISLEVSYVDDLLNKEKATATSRSKVGNVVQFSPETHVLSDGKGDDEYIGTGQFETLKYEGPAKDYYLVGSLSSLKVTNRSTTYGVDQLQNIDKLLFSDMSVNIAFINQAIRSDASALDKLIELYISFFNRVPDADGLSFWLNQLNRGTSIDEIAESFYQAGLEFSDLTGYTKTMSNTDFINIVYKNTLGRKDGADAEGLAYWNDKLNSGAVNHGQLVSTILTSAHSFERDPTWSWVAQLLDRKVDFGRYAAAGLGVSHLTPEDSITIGMAALASITPNSFEEAAKILGVQGMDVWIHR